MTKGTKLLSETDSTEVRVAVESLVAEALDKIETDKDTKTDVFFEHGRWWVKLWNLPPSAGCLDDEIVFGVVDLQGNRLGLEEL